MHEMVDEKEGLVVGIHADADGIDARGGMVDEYHGDTLLLKTQKLIIVA